MDNIDNRTESQFRENDRQIQLILNRSGDAETTIDLGCVLHNMKLKKRVFTWVLVLCLVIGVCTPLLLYQFTKTPLTVSSVVTLRYEAPKKSFREALKNGQITLLDAEYEQVTDLTAPDGTDLDLNHITSAYVLQTALDGMNLSASLTAGMISSNIGIQKVLTEASSRAKEALVGLAEAKDTEAYAQLQNAQMNYQNRFVVTLRNGFSDSGRILLKDEELKLLLDRILTVYNDYLIKTYADIKLPDDTVSIIDTQNLDVLDGLDQLRTSIDDLYDYCSEKPDTVKEYRSSRTGRSLKDWMETLQIFKSINVDYLYSMVSENAITRDKNALLTGWKYLLRIAQNNLDEVNERITETAKILDSYKNDEVIISMQESDAAKTTKVSTEYYNTLILQQTADYEKAAELKTSITDYAERITRLDATNQTEVTEEVETELARSVSSAQTLYEQIKVHMEEVFDSPMYTTFEDHSAAQGKTQGFLAASARKMIIGGVVGVIVACGLWFLAALIPEFSKNSARQKQGYSALVGVTSGKEAAEK